MRSLPRGLERRVTSREDASAPMGAPQNDMIALVADKGRALMVNDRKNAMLVKRNRSGTHHRWIVGNDRRAGRTGRSTAHLDPAN